MVDGVDRQFLSAGRLLWQAVDWWSTKTALELLLRNDVNQMNFVPKPSMTKIKLVNCSVGYLCQDLKAENHGEVRHSPKY